MNLSNVGQDDSSSEEAQSNHHQISNGKPAVPPRPRSISATRGTIISNLVNNKQLKTTNGNVFADDLPCKDNDVVNADCKCATHNNNRRFSPTAHIFFYEIFLFD